MGVGLEKNQIAWKAVNLIDGLLSDGQPKIKLITEMQKCPVK